ncbi:molybdopterin-binding protein [Methanoculleus sp. MH98A]|uniref:TOBE domain-containing protein n=1 Tax=Methanoculleus sp. MH98A TaxID=1495314 RepID=UPI0004A0FD66|nr:TOBE domain-containing protein [Methanoculleus sp. MH98A]KDE55465.1 transporter [Methanoculleus sp. MH98A]
MKVSARNQLPGKVAKIEQGMILVEITIALDGGGELTSIITKKAMENLEIAVGKKIYAVVKSTEIMVAID